MNFFVPSYQRGYRWTARQVRDLMNDISSFKFSNNDTGDNFYCLQPIVLKKCNKVIKTEIRIKN